MSRKKREGRHNYLSYEEKRFALKGYFENGFSTRDIAENIDVGESTVRYWLKKIDYNFDNIEALKCKQVSNAQRKRPVYTGLPEEVKSEILSQVQRNPSMGPLKLKQYFYRHHQLVLSEKKIYFFLKENGIIEKRRREKKTDDKNKHSRRFEYPYPMAAVQVDLLTLTLTGNKKIYLVTFLDDYSRFILLSEFIPVKSMDDVVRLLKKVVKKYGTMEHIICDKGSEFVSWKSFTRFEELLCTLDVELIASGPNTPQNQGKLERYHRTYRNDCERAYGGFTLQSEAQLETTSFVNYYNYERPHQGIGGLTPADRFFGMAEEITSELARHSTKDGKSECIYLSCNINGQKLVISGPRNGALTIYQNKE